MNIKETIQKSQEEFADLWKLNFPVENGLGRGIVESKNETMAIILNNHLKTAQLQLLQSVLEGIDKEITDYSMVFDLRLEGVLSDLEFLRAKEAYRVLNTIALPIREQINRLTKQ